MLKGVGLSGVNGSSSSFPSYGNFRLFHTIQLGLAWN